MIASLFPQRCSKGYFRRAQGVGSNGHNLPVDADEQLRPLELLGVLLDYAGEGGTKLPSHRTPDRMPLFFDIAMQKLIRFLSRKSCMFFKTEVPFFKL
mgnify:FL=1